jgi:hypothetical protein
LDNKIIYISVGSTYTTESSNCCLSLDKGNNHLGRVTIDLLFNTEMKDFLRSDQHISFLTKYLEIKCVKLSINSSKILDSLAHGRWFSPGTPTSSTTKTGRHDIAEILLKVALSTINQIKSNHL